MFTDSIPEDSGNQEILQDFQKKKAAAQLAIPTDDATVRKRLQGKN